MKAGLSGAKMRTNSSTGMSNCAVVGSSLPKASLIISRGEIGKGERAGPGRVDEKLAVIQMLAALLVIEFGIYVDAVHSVNLL